MTFGDCEFCKHIPKCGDLRVLPKKIEAKINELEKLLEGIKISDYDYVDNSRALIAQYLRGLLK